NRLGGGRNRRYTDWTARPPCTPPPRSFHAVRIILPRTDFVCRYTARRRYLAPVPRTDRRREVRRPQRADPLERNREYSLESCDSRQRLVVAGGVGRPGVGDDRARRRPRVL